MIGGGSGGGNSTTRLEPPSYQLPYLQSGLQSAQSLYNWQNPDPSTTVAPFSQDTQAGMDQIRNTATNGTGIVQNANQYANQTLNGDTLNANPFLNGAAQSGNALNNMAQGSGSNPYLDQTFNNAAMATQNQLSSQFSAAGRDPQAAEGLRSQQLNGLATSIYGGAYDADRNRQLSALGLQAGTYNDERNRQQSVLGLSPTLNQANYQDPSQLLGIGASQENLAQQRLNAPGQNLDQYLSRVSGNIGQTQTTPNTTNRGAGVLGGAMLGNQLGSQYGYGGYGAVLGGLLGGWG